MKRRLRDSESYVGGSVPLDFRGILRLLRKLKYSIYVRYERSINSLYVWVEKNEWVIIMRVFKTLVALIAA